MYGCWRVECGRYGRGAAVARGGAGVYAERGKMREGGEGGDWGRPPSPSRLPLPARVCAFPPAMAGGFPPAMAGGKGGGEEKERERPV